MTCDADGCCDVTFLTRISGLIGPGQRCGYVRPMTSYDTCVLDALGKANTEQKAGREQLLRMSFEAKRMSRDVAEPESRVGLIDRARSAASFLRPLTRPVASASGS